MSQEQPIKQGEQDTPLHGVDQPDEPLFITEEIEAQMRANGETFDPPKHVCLR